MKNSKSKGERLNWLKISEVKEIRITREMTKGKKVVVKKEINSNSDIQRPVLVP